MYFAPHLPEFSLRKSLATAKDLYIDNFYLIWPTSKKIQSTTNQLFPGTYVLYIVNVFSAQTDPSTQHLKES